MCVILDFLDLAYLSDAIFFAVEGYESALNLECSPIVYED